jgi:hypothetical protein
MTLFFSKKKENVEKGFFLNFNDFYEFLHYLRVL